jgi:AcrR family transcriptional regulator
MHERDRQRDSLLAGVVIALAEHGYAALGAEHVAAAAGVPLGAFHANFANTQEAVLAAHDLVFERFLARVLRACNAEHEWPLKVRAAIEEAIGFAVAEPEQAQLLSFDLLGSDAHLARRILDANDHLAGLLGAGRRYGGHAAELPRLTEKALVAANAAIISDRLGRSAEASLPELLPQLVELTLIPYCGGEEAARVAHGRTSL